MHSDECKPEDHQFERSMTHDSQGDTRLIQELQAMYAREKSLSIERVWARLESERAGTNATMFARQQSETSDSQKQRQQSERILHMKPKDRVPTAPKKGLPRVFGLLTAALASMVLVGSLLLVLTMTRNSHWATMLTGSQTSTVWPLPGATPILPFDCRDGDDLAERQLCIKHAEKTLDITKTFGTHKVNFLRAYADPTRLMLIYRTSDLAPTDAIRFTSLTIQPGIELPASGNVHYQNPQTHEWFYMVTFDTKNVPAGTKQIKIQSIINGVSGKTAPLDATIPFHSDQKTIEVNKTVTSKGVSLKLQRLVIIGSITSIYLQQTPQSHTIPFVTAISIKDGASIGYNGNQTYSKGFVNSTNQVVIQLTAILNTPGSCTLTFSNGNRTWTFTFTIPAN